MSATPQATSGGRFDTSAYKNVPNELGLPAAQQDKVANIKRGIEWLQRELYGLQTYAQVLTGNPDFKVHIGPISCTDGTKNLWLAPQEIEPGQDPGPLFMAHFYHEIGHALESLVYNPRTSEKVEDAIKYQATVRFGPGAAEVWGSLEDGRIEELLYGRMPGARKHIIKDVINVAPKIVDDIKMSGMKFRMEHLVKTGDTEKARAFVDANKDRMMKSPESFAEVLIELRQLVEDTGDVEGADKVAKNVMNDMGLLMAIYFASAGYDEQASIFGDDVNRALADAEIQRIFDWTHKLPKSSKDADHPSVKLMEEVVPAFMKRARELGFFSDFDQRAMNPYTQEPQVIDWNDLTKDEQDALREQAKQQLNKKDPNQQEVQILNAPKDLFQNQTPQAEPEKGQKGAPQEGQDAKSQPGESAEGEGGKEGEDSDGEAGQQSSSDSSGSGSSGSSSERKPGSDGDSSGANASDAGMDPSMGDAGGHESDDEAGGADAEGAGDAPSSMAAPEDAAGDLAGYVEAPSSLSGNAGADEFAEEEGEGQGASGEGDDLDDEGFDDAEDGESSIQPQSSPGGGGDASGDDVQSESTPGGDAGDMGGNDAIQKSDGTPNEVLDPGEATETKVGEQSAEGAATDVLEPSPAEVEQLAQELHAEQEELRLDRVKSFKDQYDALDETRHPPKAKYASKDEVARLEKYDVKAQEVKTAMQMEVGEISGAPESQFLFKQRKIEAVNPNSAPTLSEYRDVIAGEVNRLMAIFKQNNKSGYSGQYEIGTHIKGQALPAFATGQTLKVFDKRIKARKKSYAVTLLVDQSGSMNEQGGAKIDTAKIALCLQATLLDRLQVPFEILGFATVAGGGTGGYGYSLATNGAVGGHAIQHDVFKTFDEGWGTEQRARVLGIRTYGSNLDGMALAWAWDRLKRRRENVKILMTYSDGQPNPDTDQQIRIMKHVLRQMHLAGAVAIGVGLYSHAPEQLYPKAIYCDNISTLPRLVTKALEAELGKK